MQIVPAVDLKAGSVVRAVAGRRTMYRPIDSRLVEGASPADVGRAFVDIGLHHAYLADLDAIEGSEPSWEIYSLLLQSGLSLWIDAGMADVSRAERLVEFSEDHPGVKGIIGGLESLPDFATLEACLRIVGQDRFHFSLELKDGTPIAKAPEWKDLITLEIAGSVASAGVRQLMMIDLAAVGMHGGCATARLCRSVRNRYPDLNLATGGGVRDVEDLHRLEAAGCDAALVSSALHDGWITAADLALFDKQDA